LLPAKKLYQGTLFKKVKTFCEIKGYEYKIISANYGLVDPNDEIQKYDKVLKNKRDIEAIKPLVEQDLKKILNNYDTILIIAGKNYREVLSNLINERFVILKSRGIGDLVHIVSSAILPKNKTIDDYLSE
jgi:cytoplasmic iron level regulating protein YaaA (DUF328/UPF0246 family)